MRQNGNYRLAVAIAAVRIERNPATMAELYDAGNQRGANRARRLTPDELREHLRRYLAEEAPDLLRFWH